MSTNTAILYSLFLILALFQIGMFIYLNKLSDIVFKMQDNLHNTITTQSELISVLKESK